MKLFDKFDMFGSSVPKMTIEGRSQVGTSIGFLTTVFVAFTMVLFGAIQVFLVVEGHNPQISMSETADAFISSDDIFNPDNFFLAFAVQHTITKTDLYNE